MPKLGPDYDDPRGLSRGSSAGAAVGSRGTGDKGLTGFESLRGGAVFPENPDHEDVGDFASEGLVTGGCDKIPDFPPADEMSDSDVRRLWAMTAFYDTPGFDSACCLFKAARSIQNSLFAVARRQPKRYMDFLERLVDLFGIIKARTEKPYKISFDTRPRKALPKAVLAYPPFADYPRWKDNLAAAKKGNFIIVEPIPIVAKEEPIAQQPDQQSQLDKTMEELEQRVIDAELSMKGLDNTPLIKKGVKLLSTTTLGKIRKATGVVVNPPFEDQPLIQQTEFIFYHSVYSVVLDKAGEPSTVGGLLYYPILVPDPGSVMERNLHPPGVYVSVKRYGDSDFWLGEKGDIKKMLWGGIGGLVENYGGGVRAPHELQERLQKHVVNLGYAYVGAVTSPSAFDSPDVSIGLLEDKLPDLVDVTIPYTFREVSKLAKHDLENWEDLIKEIGYEIIKAVILNEVKRRVRNYLIKKIGTKIIPLINAASALYDAFTGEDERRMVRNMIACILLHVKGSGADDTHVAAKILGNILATLFRKEIIAAIVKRAAEKTGKTIRGGKPDTLPTDEETAGERTPWKGEEDDDNDLSKTLSPNKPKAGGADDENVAPPASDPAGTGNPGSGTKGFDPAALRRELEQGRALADRLKANQQAGDAKPAASPDKTAGAQNDETGSQGGPKPAKAKGAGDEHEEEETGRTQVADKAKGKKQAAEDDEDEKEAPQGKSPKKQGSKEDESDEDDEAKGTANRGKKDKGTDAKKEAQKQAKKIRDRKKKIGVMARLKKKWGDAKATIVLKAISQRDRLRGAWNNVAKGLFAHHLIPVTVLKKNEVAQAAVVGGLDFNGKKNGRLLNQSEHSGGHDEYNEIISSEMDEWARNNPGYQPADARAFVESRLPSWSDMYVQSLEIRPPQAGPGLPSFEDDGEDE